MQRRLRLQQAGCTKGSFSCICTVQGQLARHTHALHTQVMPPGS